MVQLGSLEDKYEKLDKRVKNLVTRPKTIDNILDQTRRQREESFKLRKELRNRKLEGKEKNLKISRGRIVTVHDNNSTMPTESTTSRYTSSSGYAGTKVFKSRTFVGRTGHK